MTKVNEGDAVTLRKPHPCGSASFEVIRRGADFKLRCLGCGAVIMISADKASRVIKSLCAAKGKNGESKDDNKSNGDKEVLP